MPLLLKIILIHYTISVALLWIAARIFATDGIEFTVSRCLGAAVLLTFFSNASLKFLNPQIGDWYLLCSLLAYVIVIKAVYKLAFWRCAMIALIYFLGILAAYYFFQSITA